MADGRRETTLGNVCRRASRRVVGLAAIVLFLGGAVSKEGRKEGKDNKEFRERVDRLVDAYRAKDLNRISTFYARDAHTLTFHIPFKYDTGLDDGRSTAQKALDEVEHFNIELGEPNEVWRYKHKVWTLRPFKLDFTAKDGTAVKWVGRHSAIWEKTGDNWLIITEHFLDEPVITRPAAPVAIAAAPPLPAQPPEPPPAAAAAPVPPPAAAPPAPAAPAAPAGSLADIFFDLDKWNIRPDQRHTLTETGNYLRENPEIRVLIEGHCDERQTEPYNDRLGERRAESTKAFLVAMGIRPDRMETTSVGERRPFENGQGESVWQQNRRAHFVIRAK